MGAYGSPELYPQKSQNSYPQYLYKPKTHRAAFFFGGFLVGAIIVYVFALPSKISPSAQTTSTQAIPSVSSASLPSVENVSQEYLKNWSELSVAKCLIYPDSALFPKNDSEWTILQQGAVCTVSSVVSAKNKDNSIGKSRFTVKIQYYDMYAQVTSVQIGDKVVYDSTKVQ